jgi:hypothetical protein
MKRLSEYSAEELQAAREAVCADYIENAHGIREDDHYASHVTEAEKDEFLAKSLVHAEECRQGKNDHKFYMMHRLHEKLTGECIAILP